MKDLTKVYLKAAKMVDKGDEEYTCIAVNSCGGQNPKCLYKMIFFNTTGWVSPTKAVNDKIYKKERVTFRVFLLCMAAACWRDMLPLMKGE